jgi:hypothetical protein
MPALIFLSLEESAPPQNVRSPAIRFRDLSLEVPREVSDSLESLPNRKISDRFLLTSALSVPTSPRWMTLPKPGSGRVATYMCSPEPNMGKPPPGVSYPTPGAREE